MNSRVTCNCQCWQAGPDAHWAFVCALEQIRQHPKQSADRLFDAYSHYPHEQRQNRWDLVAQLTMLVTPFATDYLITIVLEPIEETYEEDGYQIVGHEREIRLTAIFGLEGLIITGIDPQAARNGLIRIMLEHDDAGFKERIVGILKGHGMSREELAEIVRGSDSEWLLETY